MSRSRYFVCKSHTLGMNPFCMDILSFIYIKYLRMKRFYTEHLGRDKSLCKNIHLRFSTSDDNLNKLRSDSNI